MTEEYSNEDLLLFLSQSHEESAHFFELLYDRFQGRLRQYFQKKKLEPNQVEDLIQQTFVKLFEKRQRYRSGSPAEGWIFIVARSQFLDWFRAHKRQIEQNSLYLDYLESQISLPETYSNQESIFLKAQLTEMDLKLLSDRFEKGLSFEQMSQAWGVTSTSLRKRVSRLYQRLKKTKAIGE